MYSLYMYGMTNINHQDCGNNRTGNGHLFCGAVADSGMEKKIQAKNHKRNNTGKHAQDAA